MTGHVMSDREAGVSEQMRAGTVTGDTQVTRRQCSPPGDQNSPQNSSGGAGGGLSPCPLGRPAPTAHSPEPHSWERGGVPT